MHLSSRSIILAPTLAFILGACVADPYGVPDPGPALTEEPADGRYTVTYRGAPSSTPARVRDLALLRAASITLQKGGDWFEIVTDYSRIQEESKSRFEQDPFGQRSTVQGDCGVLGCPSNARPDIGQEDFDPKSTSRSFSVQSFEIIVHSGTPPFGKQDAYNALEVSNELRSKYTAPEQ